MKNKNKIYNHTKTVDSRKIFKIGNFVSANTKKLLKKVISFSVNWQNEIFKNRKGNLSNPVSYLLKF